MRTLRILKVEFLHVLGRYRITYRDSEADPFWNGTWTLAAEDELDAVVRFKRAFTNEHLRIVLVGEGES